VGHQTFTPFVFVSTVSLLESPASCQRSHYWATMPFAFQTPPTAILAEPQTVAGPPSPAVSDDDADNSDVDDAIRIARTGQVLRGGSWQQPEASARPWPDPEPGTQWWLPYIRDAVGPLRNSLTQSRTVTAVSAFAGTHPEIFCSEACRCVTASHRNLWCPLVHESNSWKFDVNLCTKKRL